MDTPPETDNAPPEHAPRAKVILAFAIVYVVWGSTYLAIRFAVETLPPFLMGGARFLVAGLVLFIWARLRGATTEPGQWRVAGIAGVLLLFGGNGALVWSEQRVASGIAALLVATLPVWMVLLDWLRPGGTRPRAGVFAGLALGLGGLGLLVGPAALPSSGRSEVDLAAAGVLVLGSISWAAGSIFLRSARHARSATLSNAMQMLVGGATLAIAGIGAGELGRLSPETASTRSVLSLAYLAIFGSLIGFSAYTYILRVSTPARVATYAYVNPVVAMLLGWAFASEPITVRTLVAAAIILAGVVIIGLAEGQRAESERGRSGSISENESLLRSRHRRTPLARR